ncbi:CrcB-like protein-domain-containing protein [Usnea florida]
MTPENRPKSRRERLWLDLSTNNLSDEQNSEDGPVEDYTLPNNYQNLDELRAPSPIKNSQEDHRQRYLEDRNNGRSPDDNLDEIAAPSPVDDSLDEREQECLEDRGSGSPSTDENRGKNHISPSRQRASKLATEVYTISYLILFSILGTLSRLGLQALTFYPGAPVQTGVLWANVGGSLLMGFLSEDRKLFREEWGPRHAAVKKTMPLYIGLATGFCGSFTSFSSFMRDCFFALSNALHTPISHPSAAPISETSDLHRNPGYSFMAVLAVLIITIGLSLGALQVGAHLALGLEPYTPSIPFFFGRRIIDRSTVFLASGCWLGAIFMAIWPPDRPGGPVGNKSWVQETWRSQALFALVFAPLGCLLRFYASLHLNGKIKSFPLGTFAVNILGTMMEAVFLNLQRVPVGGMIGCQVLQGLSDGFCGCLTTVSTWVAELKGLHIRHAYVYAAMSVGVALGLMVIILGSLQWTDGLSSILCTT